jgi:Kef-type K+ transport system membrane component KefB
MNVRLQQECLYLRVTKVYGVVVSEVSGISLIFVIFSGAAILCTLAIYTRQSLLVAYMVLGAVLGPWGLKLVPNANVVAQVGDIGIIFLLFLLGLHLQPQNLLQLFRKTLLLTIVSSIVFAAIGYGIGLAFNYTHGESLIIGSAMMFSSTIIALKLLPTTVLHHKHKGEVMISISLLQDVLAIIVLILLTDAKGGSISMSEIIRVFIAFPVLAIMAMIFVRYVLIKLLAKFDTVQEYIWILSIGWCLLVAEIAHKVGLSAEVGAFIAGVALAEHPIAQYIADSLKPLRDLFLVLFFFAVGAHFNPNYFSVVIIPALILATCVLILKPLIYRFLLVREGESKSVAWEIGVRLGQASEFSLLVAYLAGHSALIQEKTSFLIQAATIITFIVSCYWVVLKYPTPMATSAKLRQN